MAQDEAYQEAERRIEEARRTGATVLDLGSMRLAALPESLDQLTKLNTLDLRNNQLTSLPESLGQLTQLQTLDLNSNQLTSLPEWLGQLTQLQKLDLQHNQLTPLPEWLGQLTQLKRLTLNGNQLTSLPESLGQLTQLKTLALSSNQLTALPESLGQLTQLQALNLCGNQLTALPESLGQLTQLQELALNGNQLTSLPEWLGQLTQLRKLVLCDGMGGNIFYDFPVQVRQLTQVEEFWMGNCKLRMLPECIGELTRLKILKLFGNHLTSLPESLGQLTQLQTLDLQNNQLTALPECLGQLTQLETLDLRSNQLTSLPESLGQLTQLQTLELRDNPLTDPPPSVINQGTKAVLAYLREKGARGEQPHWRSKMLLVGEGGVGKTQLLRRLKGEGFESQSETTHGIDVRELELKHPTEPATDMTLNCWDFGGQQIYHATHQFFLTGRSLFLLCWSARIGHEASKLDYWLDTIHSLAPDAPIMLVATHGDERDAKLPYDGLKKKFPQIAGQWTVSSKDKPDEDKKNDPAALAEVEKWKKSITSLFEDIRKLAADKDKLPLMGAPWPTSYFNAAEALRALEKTEITRDALFDLFEQNEVTDEKSKETLAHLLHNLGDITWFDDDEELGDTVLLDAQWLSNKVSDVLEHEAIIDGLGIFRKEHMEEVWPDLTSDMRDRLLRLMERFDLSYRIPDDPQNKSLVVERLNLDPPEDIEEKWDAILGEAGCKEVSMRFNLNIKCPSGIPTWFIARAHRFTTNTHWRYGALFADNRDPTKRRHLAFVHTPVGKNTVELAVRGPNPQTFFVLLRDGIENIFERFPGLRDLIKRTMPCPCPDNDCENTRHRFDYAHLDSAIARGRDTLQCPVGFKDVSIPEIIMGIHPSQDDAAREIFAAMQQRFDDLEREMAKQHAEHDEGAKRRHADLLLKMQSMRELMQLEFSKNFARDQRLEETHTPSVFTLRPKGGGQWAKGFVGQTWELRLWCEYPGGWHWKKDWPVYEIKEPAKWLGAVAPHLKRLFKVLRFAAPLAAPLTGYAFKEYEAMLKDDIELMKGLIDGFKELNIDFEMPEAGAAGFDAGGRYGDSEQRPGKAQGVSLLELRRMLDANAPDWQATCGIRKILTPENHYLWLCEEHIKEYLI